MKRAVVCLMVFFTFVQYSEQLQNLLNTSMHKCIECLCHARTGCFRRVTCASYSINETYWQIAGYPTLPGNDPNSHSSYERCMKNENCILNTIVGYTNTFSNLDCNCDGKYDCQDMLKLHLYGRNCGKAMESYYLSRYNYCAGTRDLSPMTSNVLCNSVAP
ncbi:hypothetical protein Trydic_g13784 [Trypoxylus dichotomus]